MAIIFFTIAASTPVMAEDTLFSGEFLENGPYKFIMQGDCNLVVYVNKTKVLWNSRTNSKGTACRTTLQNNGNPVVLSGSDVVWTSDCARGPNKYRLIVQSDGNVVIDIQLRLVGDKLHIYKAGRGCSEE